MLDREVITQGKCKLQSMTRMSVSINTVTTRLLKRNMLMMANHSS